MKVMNQRQRQRAEQVRQLVAMALLRGEVHSTLPLARLAVVDVWVSADLKIARLFLSLPAEMDEKTTLDKANAELSGPLRKLLATQLGGKFTPSITFWPLADGL
jgi:ribosome-binding factor A